MLQGGVLDKDLSAISHRRLQIASPSQKSFSKKKKKKNEQWQTHPRGDTGDWWFFIFPSTSFGSIVQHGPMSSEMTWGAKAQHLLCKSAVWALKSLSFILLAIRSMGQGRCSCGPRRGSSGLRADVLILFPGSESVSRGRKKKWGEGSGSGVILKSAGQTLITPSLGEKAWIADGGFGKKILALIVCKHVYYQHVKHLRKSNKSAVGGSAKPKGISVKLGMERSNFKLSWERSQLSYLFHVFWTCVHSSNCVVWLVESESWFQAWMQSRMSPLIPVPPTAVRMFGSYQLLALHSK